jgi:hypothetical protein
MMLLDSIIMCVTYLTSVFGSFTRNIAEHGCNGKGWMGKRRLLDCILICIADWTVQKYWAVL